MEPAHPPRRPASSWAPALVLLALAPAAAGGQEVPPIGGATDGPVVEGFGAVYFVRGLEIETPVDREYRIVFDVAQSPGEPGAVNPHLNSVARFLNMHGRAGVPVERMRLAVVLHGGAAKDALREGPFRERYGVRNGNFELIRRLAEVGVEFYVCGQTAMHRGFPDDELAEPVVMALSAMTARAVLAERGYLTVY